MSDRKDDDGRYCILTCHDLISSDRLTSRGPFFYDILITEAAYILNFDMAPVFREHPFLPLLLIPPLELPLPLSSI